MTHYLFLVSLLLLVPVAGLPAVELWNDLGGQNGFGTDNRTLSSAGYAEVTNDAIPSVWGPIYGRELATMLWVSPAGFAFNYDSYLNYDTPATTWKGNAFPDLLSAQSILGANATRFALTTQTSLGPIQVGVESLPGNRLDLVYRTPVAVRHIGGMLGCSVTGYGPPDMYYSGRAFHPLVHLWGNRLHEASTTGVRGEVRIDLKRPPLAFVLDNGRPIGPNYMARIDLQGPVTEPLTADKLTISGATINGTITSTSNTTGYSSNRYLVPLQVDARSDVVVITIDGSKFNQTAFSPYNLGGRFTVDRAAPVLTVSSALTASKATKIAATATDEQPITWTWALVSGPGKVDLKDFTTSTLDFWADTPGTYVVSCTATDDISNSSTNNVTITWTGSTGLFIQDLYTKGLGRPADDAGLFFNGRLADTTTLQQVGIGLLTSPEFRDNPSRTSFQNIIGAAYQALLGRDPDQQGLDAFLTDIGNGMIWPDVVMSLILSPEFQALHPSAPAPDRLTWEYRMRSEMRRIYLITKKRLPTASELAWIASFPYINDYQRDQAQASVLSQIRSAITPALDQPRPADVVDNLYRLTLNREPEANGRAFWLTRIALGTGVNDLMDGLLNSAEFKANRWPSLQFPSPLGPDYTIVTSREQPSLLDQWVDITRTGTSILAGADDRENDPLKLPNDTQVFSSSYDTLVISPNGRVRLTKAGVTEARIFLWGSSDLMVDSEASVHYLMTLTGWTVQYTNVRWYSRSGRSTFQIKYTFDGVIRAQVYDGFGLSGPVQVAVGSNYVKRVNEPNPGGPWVIEFRPSGASVPAMPSGNG